MLSPTPRADPSSAASCGPTRAPAKTAERASTTGSPGQGSVVLGSPPPAAWPRPTQPGPGGVVTAMWGTCSAPTAPSGGGRADGWPRAVRRRETRKLFIERYKSVTAEMYSNKLGVAGRVGRFAPRGHNIGSLLNNLYHDKSSTKINIEMKLLSGRRCGRRVWS